MKVKESMEQSRMSVSHGPNLIKSNEMPPLNKIIVRSAKPYESRAYNNIWIGIEPIPEFSANSIAYRVRDDLRTKTKDIADFIDKNKGKRLLVILEMDLP